VQGQVGAPLAAPSLAQEAAGRLAEAPGPPARRRRREQTPYLLLAPTILFMVVFFAWPMVQALNLAFEDASGAFSLDPIRRMVNDVNFLGAVRNTVLLTLVVVPAQVVLALIMSLLLMSGLRWAGVFLYAWAIPLAISDLAAGLVWLSIFTDRGYLNSVIVKLGLSETGFSFLSYEHPISIFLCVAIAETWRATALVMVILLAGLQVIPKDYAEAAEVFGATAWQRVRHVTVPLLKASLQVALIIRTILAFQAFAVVIALAAYNMPVLAGETYRWYSDLRNPNVAAAYALLIMLFSLVNTGIYLRALRVRDEEVGVA
jgi:multiple sugar transport system permease protein